MGFLGLLIAVVSCTQKEEEEGQEYETMVKAKEEEACQSFNITASAELAGVLPEPQEVFIGGDVEGENAED